MNEGKDGNKPGMTSHAAVVARGWGKCCVSSCADILVTEFLEGCLGLIF